MQDTSADSTPSGIQEHYDRPRGKPSKLADVHSIALKWLGESQGGKILDAGCGDGLFGEALSKQGWQASGVEINQECLAVAETRLREVLSFDLTAGWPYEDECFDAINSSAVIEHLFNYHAFLAECRRCLKPEGKLILGFPNIASLQGRIELLFGRVPHWMRNDDHIRAWTISRLRDAVETHGFQMTRSAGAYRQNTMTRRIMRVLLPTLSTEAICEFRKLA